MEYEDMVSCYEIIKRKQCVSYLKDDILDVINQKVVSDVRDALDLPYDENVYFDLICRHGRTYEAGIRLNIKTNHITYDDFYKRSNCWNFDKVSGYPKVVFKKNVFNSNEIVIPEDGINELKRIFNVTVKHKHMILDYENELTDFEKNGYKIKMRNGRYTVLSKINENDYEVILDNHYIGELNIDTLSKEIQAEMNNICKKKFLNDIETKDEYISVINEFNAYDLYTIDIGTDYYSNNLHFKLYFGKLCIYDEILQPNYNDFIQKTNIVKETIESLRNKYISVNKLIKKINDCKNGFWKAKFCVDFKTPYIMIKQKFAPSLYLHENIYLYDEIDCLDEKYIITEIVKAMKSLIKQLENSGYRIMEVE